MFNKLLTLLLIAGLMTALVTGCAASGTTASPDTTTTTAPAESETVSTAAPDKVQIGFSVGNADDPWQAYLLDDARTQSAEYKDVAEFTFVNAKNDPELQLIQLDILIKRGCTAVVIHPVGNENSGDLTAKATAAGISLIIVNRQLTTQADAAAYIGPDLSQVGPRQVDFIGEKLSGGGKIAILSGDKAAGSIVASAYIQTIKDAVAAKYAKLKVLYTGAASWDQAKAEELAADWLKKDPTIKAILAQNDAMALGAAAAIEAAGLTGQVLVVGCDGSTEALAQMTAGKLDFTLYQDPLPQADGAIDAAVQAAKKQAFEVTTLISLDDVSPASAASFAAKWPERTPTPTPTPRPTTDATTTAATTAATSAAATSASSAT